MIKCPNCGSTAQPEVIETDYVENGWTINRIATYQCGCGCQFQTVATFESDGDEMLW